MKELPTCPEYPEIFVWDFIHSYRYEVDEIAKFCQEVLGFTPHHLSIAHNPIYDSAHSNQLAEGYCSTTFTLRTVEDAFAVNIVFAELERKI